MVNVTISPSGPIQGAMVGSPQVINCTVSTVSGVESSSVMISWMRSGGGSGEGCGDGSGEGSKEGPIIMSDSRISVTLNASNTGNTYTSSLQFTYLMEGDEGTYTCNVMILETSEVDSVEIANLFSKHSYICSYSMRY